MKILPFFPTFIRSAQKAEKVFASDLKPVQLLGIQKDWATFKHRLIVPKGARVHYFGKGNPIANLKVKAGATFDAPNALLKKVVNQGQLIIEQAAEIITQKDGRTTADKVALNTMLDYSEGNFKAVEKNYMQDHARGNFGPVAENHMKGFAKGNFGDVKANYANDHSSAHFKSLAQSYQRDEAEVTINGRLVTVSQR